MKSLRLLIIIALTLLFGTILGVGLQRYFLGVTASGDRPEAQLSPSVISDRLQGRLKLYVLIGQSNMVGKAEIPADIATSANVFTFGNDYQWQVARPPVDSPQDQVDAISTDDPAGFGPAMPFALSLIEENNNQIIGLIPCAKSGSSITDWQKSPSDTTLYGSCLKRVRAASPMGTVSGILFFQGEADAIDPQRFPSLTPDAAAYAEKFATFAYNFRTDIGRADLPFVYAQLGQPSDLEGLPNWGDIQQQQENLQIPNGMMITTRDLPMDGIHFTADSYRVIGQRFADAMRFIDSGRAMTGQATGEAATPELSDGERLPTDP
ncbi:MAG: sialate O-acetylesterase [Cyanobacteria bacterium J06560_6]